MRLSYEHKKSIEIAKRHLEQIPQYIKTDRLNITPKQIIDELNEYLRKNEDKGF